ncbi:MAG: phage holin family protein [Bacteroidia bacterium]|nr:phage holin family protein [Bacteroidia bacterium]
MKFIIQIVLSALSVLVTGYLMPGVKIDGLSTALVVAVVLALLNVFLKPVLVLLSFPVTFFTLGLFLLVINAIIILLASKLVDGFHVSGFWSALFFSIVLSIVNAILGGWASED